MVILQVAISFVLLILILQKPYLGVVFTAASLPIANVLPAIPLASSVVPIMGGVTLVSFLMYRKKVPGKRTPGLANVLTLGLLFIIWIFISNPQAAWFGVDRNWISTFFQLWILAWLAGELLDTPEKHHVFMWCYCLITALSAIIAIQQGGSFGEDIDVSKRFSGLAQGANTAARYFVVAALFFIYLRGITPKPWPRFWATAGGLITFLGVIITVSRTGLLLIFIAMGLLILLAPGRKNQIQLIIIFVIAMIALWLLSDDILNIVTSIVPSISKGTDTVGLRYALWKAGWRMWVAHPILGIGIGRYPLELRNFANDLMAPMFWKGMVAHNMYVQILAEAGIIGFFLFASLLYVSLKNIWHARNNMNAVDGIPLANIWFIVTMTMALGGITKTDLADKMLWISMGVSVYFYNQTRITALKSAADDAPKMPAFNRRHFVRR